MWTFLGVLMVLTVSGDEVIEGVLEDSVLLPCNCSDINLNEEFKWQMENPLVLVLKYHSNTANFSGRYKGRAKTFLNKTNNNCSVLLTNITAADQGKYSCRFHRENQYQFLYVNLNVSASYSVCQRAPNNISGDLSVKDFQCDVSGRYGDAEIQWKLDGQLLTNSSTTNITNKYTRNAPAGLYHFHSKLITKLNMTSAPTCEVKAKGISTVISYECGAVNEPVRNPKPEYVVRYIKAIPIMLVLGLSLVLWRRCKFSQSLQRIQEVEAVESG
ncbi:butyrophilin subfamily 3 member A2 [Siniperca chuatsi]|uniref:butyrophilin subfamily 3 member A2 n=1 Tax=Siniperca chuatsi TaxID=119488 RepID=UPI001CE18ED8|nr:butyrophilin subfamily 3 member A2 [Siniperca chuatsi]